MTTDLNTISDDVIRDEYVKRFSQTKGERLSSSTGAVDHLRSFYLSLPKDQEHFSVVFLSGQNEIITTECVFSGSLTSSAIYPRELVKKVLQYECAAIICCHNHPSGSIRPSSHDRKVTQKLQTALESIDVRILDHLILGGIGFYSFAEEGLL